VNNTNVEDGENDVSVFKNKRNDTIAEIEVNNKRVIGGVMNISVEDGMNNAGVKSKGYDISVLESGRNDANIEVTFKKLFLRLITRRQIMIK
jgi:hypothetical protein